ASASPKARSTRDCNSGDSNNNHPEPLGTTAGGHQVEVGGRVAGTSTPRRSCPVGTSTIRGGHGGHPVESSSPRWRGRVRDATRRATASMNRGPPHPPRPRARDVVNVREPNELMGPPGHGSSRPRSLAGGDLLHTL